VLLYECVWEDNMRRNMYEEMKDKTAILCAWMWENGLRNPGEANKA
jgi:hypothetical protein